MLVASVTTFLAATFLFSTSTAAPTRTHCRCTVVADPPPVFSPSVAHWTPAQPPPSHTPKDICSNLGPELENFQHTKSDLYDSYLARTEGQVDNNDEQQPLTTKVLINYATGRELRARKNGHSEPRPTSRPHPRIVCHSEAEPFTEYQSSFTTLWVLQIIIAISILACVIEGVHSSVQWYSANPNSQTLDRQGRSIRLPGNSRLVLQFFHSNAQGGLAMGEKMQNAETMPMLVVHAPNGERVCINYEEDDDDEMYRPVM
ncbi:hypothetical protein GQ44DRAFT_293071 [Phaeosphaeriaceae sp. PMI808]|nr:hypothetical protein GQ44DRAFT_293071 [Phaeosphaeriaceae sp. PMI808]